MCALLLFSGSSQAPGAAVARITELLTQPVATATGVVNPYLEIQLGDTGQAIDLAVLQVRSYGVYVDTVVSIAPAPAARMLVVHEGDWIGPRWLDAIYLGVDRLGLGSGNTSRALVLYDHATGFSTLTAPSRILAEPGVVDVVNYALGSSTGYAFGDTPIVRLAAGGALLRSDLIDPAWLLAAGPVDTSLQFAGGESLTPGRRDRQTLNIEHGAHTPEPAAVILLALAAAVTGPRPGRSRACRSVADAGAAPRRPR